MLHPQPTLGADLDIEPVRDAPSSTNTRSGLRHRNGQNSNTLDLVISEEELVNIVKIGARVITIHSDGGFL